MFENKISHSNWGNKPKKVKSLVVLVISLLVFSQSFAQYSMRKYTVNSGGATMSGGQFEMKSSVGQVDASNTLSQGNYQLNGGFWHKNNDLIFKNGFE